jgi:hypothetical protein
MDGFFPKDLAWFSGDGGEVNGGWMSRGVVDLIWIARLKFLRTIGF